MKNEEGTTKYKQQLEGVAVRRSGDKTVAVEVVRVLQHPVYGKRVKKTKRYLAHDPNNSVAVGDIVAIQESRPHSKRKRWEVVPEDSSSKAK